MKTASTICRGTHSYAMEPVMHFWKGSDGSSFGRAREARSDVYRTSTSEERQSGRAKLPRPFGLPPKFAQAVLSALNMDPPCPVASALPERILASNAAPPRGST
jgi:hypothetical protein